MRQGESRGIVAVVAILVLAVLVPLALAPRRLPRFLLGFAYTGPLVDASRWQAWAAANPNLFGPLGETARFAVVETPDDSTGLVFTRTRDGITVEKTHFLVFRRLPLLLAMRAATAEELLRLKLSDGNKFWDGVKYLVQARQIVAYVQASRRELDRVGLIGFLQVIDAIPPKS